MKWGALAILLFATPTAAEDLYTGRSGDVAIWICRKFPRSLASLVADPDKAARTIIHRRRDPWEGIVDFSAKPGK